jgi:methionyl-tRNA formyltransferase
LDCFPKGVYNIHAGLLPKYRGASPIQSCILAGETQTGVCIIKTELGLDTGDILRMQTLDILQNETYGQLSTRLSLLGAELIVTAIEDVRNGTATLTPQGEENVNVVRKITKEQAQMDFGKSAIEIVNLVRAMNPAPVAFTTLENNKINVWEAEKAVLTDEENAYMQTAKIGEILSDKAKRGLLVKCGDGAVKLVKVQPSGGKIMNGGDLINGRKAQKGQVFSC